jgi:hypothetical protein
VRPPPAADVAFHVYPLATIGGEVDREYYFAVCVYETIADMRAAMVAMGRSGIQADHALASCITTNSVGDPENRMLGVLMFAEDHFGSGVVAHEIAHAAFRVAERCGVRVTHWRRAKPWWRRWRDEVDQGCMQEEIYADVVEALTRQFWREAYARGIAS